VPFKFRETAQDCQHQSTMWRCGIGPGIAQRFERCASFANRIEVIEEIARRSRQLIQLAHDKRIAFA
jgi:hypothetical protein